MSDCRFEEYFLPDTPETTFEDQTLRNLQDAFLVRGPYLTQHCGWAYREDLHARS